MYAIKKGNLYVSKPGSEKSYTSNPSNARTFETIEDAKKNKCENEHIVRLSIYEYPVKE